jgi:hypothetical protein
LADKVSWGTADNSYQVKDSTSKGIHPQLHEPVDMLMKLSAEGPAIPDVQDEPAVF